MRRFLILLATLAACAGLSTLPAAATPSYCGLVWGSQDKSNPNYSQATLTNVRAGRHECFDRVVVDLAGPSAGYLVRYVDTVTEDGSGAPVPLRGGAFLQVTVNSPAYDNAGNLTYRPTDRTELANVNGYPTLRQIAWAVSFEGQSTIGLGVRARLPFRVSTLDNPTRVVIDVAHYW
ncbi:AMIN-like domain-containing (lipo)protein [Nocardia sp. IBHARD005]|uniref:AMIN-like domain-containing (lipo)protein n=1 Tax=Nocardia sp. IBHARD005 TaxID=3457765 RepID=UPI0040580B16